MVTVQQIDENRISLRCHYSYRQRCRELPGAVFDQDHKVWVVPIEYLPSVQAAFWGELFFKTPLWKLEGRPEPEKKPIRYFGPEPALPELALKPYGYQKEGIRFMIDRLNNVGFVLNGDAVGLGKTLQTIGALKWFVENRGCRKILVICKKSLKTQWEEEIRRIADWQEVPIFITGGSTKKRKLAPYEGIQNAPFGILITNYHDFLNWKDEIDKVNFDMCVIDEAHCIKGHDGKMNKLIADTCNGKRTILLTGTPIMSRPEDIWGIVHLATPKFFGTYEEFKKEYIIEEFNRKFYRWEFVGAKNLDVLQDKLSEFLIMRSAEEAAVDLPKQRKAKHIACPMDNLQIKLQAMVEDRKRKQDERKKKLVETYGLNERTWAEIEKMDAVSKMYIATLQFIADDPAIFKPEDTSMPADLKQNINDQFGKMVPDTYKMSSKTEATLDAVSELLDADEKVLIFCHFASSAKLLKRLLDKMDEDGAKARNRANAVMYTGSESDNAREANIRAFKYDSECRVLIGTEAMAEGLNLQVARHIIHYEQADTYAQREQRNGRIRRIGSKYEYVNVLDICTHGPDDKERVGASYDQIKIAKLRRDYRLTAAVLQKNT